MQTTFSLGHEFCLLPLSFRSRRVTAFCTENGLFEFKIVPSGISVGCQGLITVIDELFADLKGPYVLSFLEDLMVYSPSVDQHGARVLEVLGRLQRAGFTLNPEKVTLRSTDITYLGNWLSAKCNKIIPDSISAIQNYSRTTNLRALRLLIGMVGFYSLFIPDCSGKAAALHEFKRKCGHFIWLKEHHATFECFKQALCEAPTLQPPDFVRGFFW
jgi:hypothetical protein